MSNSILTTDARALICEIPEELHKLCAEALNKFAAAESSVHSPAYICNMVDSTLIPLSECLIRTYADGILLRPFAL